MYRVNLYKDARGHCPSKELFNFLDIRNDKESKGTLQKVLYQIKRLENKGTRSGAGITKHIRGDIWELRPGKYRIFYFVDGNQIYLLNGFRKETKKTPDGEIEKAENLFKDWKKTTGNS